MLTIRRVPIFVPVALILLNPIEGEKAVYGGSFLRASLDVRIARYVYIHNLGSSILCMIYKFVSRELRIDRSE